MASADSKLFQPLTVGKLSLQNRLVLAPLTRFRATDEHLPMSDIVSKYYEQRAVAPGTLLISEGTFVSPQAAGFSNAPGIWTQAQIDAWKPTTAAVHRKGSHIYLQLWHMGRASKAEVMKAKGLDVVSSSDLPISSETPQPRALTEAEIQRTIGEYAQAAKNAVEAGFDGVEIHGANGYLIDQFTQDNANQRTDAWGGSIENRSRFGIEVANAVANAIGSDRVGYRISPYSTFQGMRMHDPVPQFSHLVGALRSLNLAYLHVVESRISGNADIESTEKVDFALDIWNKPGKWPTLIAGGFTPDSAKKCVDDERPDKDICVVFGRYWISTPDLVFRIKEGIDLTPYDRKTFYSVKSPVGYTDYPFSKEFEARL